MAYIKINLNTYLSMNYNWFNLFSCSYVFQKKPVLLFSCLQKKTCSSVLMSSKKLCSSVLQLLAWYGSETVPPTLLLTH